MLGIVMTVFLRLFQLYYSILGKSLYLLLENDIDGQI